MTYFTKVSLSLILWNFVNLELNLSINRTPVGVDLYCTDSSKFNWVTVFDVIQDSTISAGNIKEKAVWSYIEFYLTPIPYLVQFKMFLLHASIKDFLIWILVEEGGLCVIKFSTTLWGGVNKLTVSSAGG